MTIEAFTLGELMAIPDPMEGKVTVQDGYIIIRDRYVYEVPLNECTTHSQITDWVMHLCEKAWVDTSIIHRFIKVAREEMA